MTTANRAMLRTCRHGSLELVELDGGRVVLRETHGDSQIDLGPGDKS